MDNLAFSKKDDKKKESVVNYYKDIENSISNHRQMEIDLNNRINNLENIDFNYENDISYISVTGSDVGISMFNWATQFLGNPYVFGGSSLTNGIDCSGFTMQIYRNIGIELPHFAQSQQRYGIEIPFGKEVAGDLVFYGTSLNNITHVGMADGNGNMIHASSPSTGIIISPIYNPISIKRIVY